MFVGLMGRSISSGGKNISIKPKTKSKGNFIDLKIGNQLLLHNISYD